MLEPSASHDLEAFGRSLSAEGHPIMEVVTRRSLEIYESYEQERRETLQG
jgi:hypothetical protein